MRKKASRRTGNTKRAARDRATEDQRIAWLRQLVEWQREMRDPGEFMSTLKVDLYPEEVYTFTPRGRVIVLPRDATPIDFAYAIHCDVGNTCVGAKVNGTHASAEVHAEKRRRGRDSHPTGSSAQQDWLSLVKTSRARNKIKHVINAAERAKAVEIGQKSLEKEARRWGNLGRISKDDLETVATEYGVSKTEDLYAALGFGRFSARQVLQKGAPENAAAPAEVQPKPEPQPRRGLPIGGRRSDDSRERARRGSGVSREVLQSAAGGAHRRLHHPRQGRGGALGSVLECAEPDV